MTVSAAMSRWPLLFFLSGLSGLIYQVVWVRQLRLARDQRVSAVIERQPYLALVFSMRSRQ